MSPADPVGPDPAALRAHQPPGPGRDGPARRVASLSIMGPVGWPGDLVAQREQARHGVRAHPAMMIWSEA